jgi:hypothetical protein
MNITSKKQDLRAKKSPGMGCNFLYRALVPIYSKLSHFLQRKHQRKNLANLEIQLFSHVALKKHAVKK